MPPLRWVVAALCAVSVLAASGRADAQVRAAVIVQGLSLPVDFVQDPGDPHVQFVVEQGGRIRVLRDRVLLATPLLDLSASIASGGERGLLGLAFPPDATGNRFFVNFTDRSGDTVVARFRRSDANRLVAEASSRLDLRWSTGERVIRQPFANHNGGNLEFGPDGYLYVGLGDGGSGNDPGNRAQDGSTLLGKMLRIDVGVTDEDDKGFRVPPDNPFLGGRPVPALPETWAFGLRNPWRYSFDDPARGGTGALVIGDVGQNAFEEIDYEPPGRGGRNYGWRVREGLHPNVASPPPAFGPVTDPILDYGHGTGVSVIGGVVYRGRSLGPAFLGRYFYADLVGRVWSLGLSVDSATGDARVTGQLEHTAQLGGQAALGPITSFGVDAQGEAYLVTYSPGRVLKLVPADRDEDGLPDWWEEQFGLSPASAAGDDGAAGDPDSDGSTNLEEYRQDTHPRGSYRRAFGRGLARGAPGMQVVFVNPNPTPATLLLRFVDATGAGRSRCVRLAPQARLPVSLAVTSPAGAVVEVLRSFESDAVVVVEGLSAGERRGETTTAHGR
ncbi:MAG: yliI 1 [Acidobacteria bacterium]|nr:yliI 1 [Acidobacteriota bacterium]